MPTTKLTEARTMLYELSVDAFLEGCSDLIPNPEEFGLTDEKAQEVLNERVLESLSA